MSEKNTKLVIVNKTRFIIFVTIVLLFLSIIMGGIFKLDKAYSSTYKTWKEITIQSGDTLWHIARKNNPHNHDTRKVVYEIMKFNSMEDASIRTGDVIKIPTN
ncbi:cell division suppressor protein YneA [Sporosalibacterium faouarense]|uniref:cell division suppressor protein YneA n=1 Tax=Sporosalibacterium faouarense TaxID=516123 RepID=UPI00141D0EC5|nr:LysM peptidoglycan-binding domain-containing protein [Sporosalibacterium faouarense]MTI48121.1 LysM peptidoglycan-binding domain-containing protein [Bacillota bacterium]